MLTFQLTHAIVLLAAIFLIDKCHAHPAITHEARPLCESCGERCDQCEFGFTTSTVCGISECRKDRQVPRYKMRFWFHNAMVTVCMNVSECRKGPGGICGGPSDSWGLCADGLMCSNNRCTGCSGQRSLDNLTCSANTTCLPDSLERGRYLDNFNSSIRIAK